MLAVSGSLKPDHACDPIACLSGVHSLIGVPVNLAATLKAPTIFNTLGADSNWCLPCVAAESNRLHATRAEQGLGTARVWSTVRCAFFDRGLHSRLPLVPTPLLRLKR